MKTIQLPELPTRKPGESLTRDNYWDVIQEQYPESVLRFSVWFDQYKKNNKWDSLFSGTVVDPGGPSPRYKPTKFYDIPLAMQVGILLEYFSTALTEDSFIDNVPDPTEAEKIQNRELPISEFYVHLFTYAFALNIIPAS